MKSEINMRYWSNFRGSPTSCSKKHIRFFSIVITLGHLTIIFLHILKIFYYNLSLLDYLSKELALLASVVPPFPLILGQAAVGCHKIIGIKWLPCSIFHLFQFFLSRKYCKTSTPMLLCSSHLIYFKISGLFFFKLLVRLIRYVFQFLLCDWLRLLYRFMVRNTQISVLCKKNNYWQEKKIFWSLGKKSIRI